mmetsp:Transcript_9108/g.29960  ORF Transcript_9108/g.29960 Transcript_9108/m.29960 type:complete len:351 (-) Transcript_9108:164-1216(-)
MRRSSRMSTSPQHAAWRSAGPCVWCGTLGSAPAARRRAAMSFRSATTASWSAVRPVSGCGMSSMKAPRSRCTSSSAEPGSPSSSAASSSASPICTARHRSRTNVSAETLEKGVRERSCCSRRCRRISSGCISRARATPRTGESVPPPTPPIPPPTTMSPPPPLVPASSTPPDEPARSGGSGDLREKLTELPSGADTTLRSMIGELSRMARALSCARRLLSVPPRPPEVSRKLLDDSRCAAEMLSGRSRFGLHCGKARGEGTAGSPGSAGMWLRGRSVPLFCASPCDRRRRCIERNAGECVPPGLPSSDSFINASASRRMSTARAARGDAEGVRDNEYPGSMVRRSLRRAP